MPKSPADGRASRPVRSSAIASNRSSFCWNVAKKAPHPLVLYFSVLRYVRKEASTPLAFTSSSESILRRRAWSK